MSMLLSRDVDVCTPFLEQSTSRNFPFTLVVTTAASRLTDLSAPTLQRLRYKRPTLKFQLIAPEACSHLNESANITLLLAGISMVSFLSLRMIVPLSSVANLLVDCALDKTRAIFRRFVNRIANTAPRSFFRAWNLLNSCFTPVRVNFRRANSSAFYLCAINKAVPAGISPSDGTSTLATQG